MSFPNQFSKQLLAGREFLANQQISQPALVIGVDEVGRGPLAGPVTVAALTFQKLESSPYLPAIKDSKQLTENKRQKLAKLLTNDPNVNFAIINLEASVIDRLNILNATKQAMVEAIKQIPNYQAGEMLIDGNNI